MSLVTIYAVFLSISTVTGGTFTPFVRALSLALTPVMFVLEFILFGDLAFDYFLPVLLILYVFWLAVIQLHSASRRKLERLIHESWPFFCLFFKLEMIRIRCRVHFNTTVYSWLSRAKRGLKTVFWKCLLASPLFVFLLQIVFAVVSLTFTFAQKFVKNPHPDDCDLAGSEEDD